MWWCWGFFQLFLRKYRVIPEIPQVYPQNTRVFCDISPLWLEDATQAVHAREVRKLRQQPPAQVRKAHALLPLYLCQKAATALIAAAEEDAEEADTPNFLKEIKFILGQRFCDPEELNGEKLRNTLSSSDITRCFQIDGIFAASDSDDGFREKRWVEIEELVEKIPKLDLSGALKKWRLKEAADTEKEVTRLMRTAA